MHFSLLLCIPSVAKYFCLVAKAQHDLCVESKGSLDVASTTALEHWLCSSLCRPQPHDVRRPWRSSLWDAEQFPGLPGTAPAVGSLSYALVLAVVTPCLSPDMD